MSTPLRVGDVRGVSVAVLLEVKSEQLDCVRRGEDETNVDDESLLLPLEDTLTVSGDDKDADKEALGDSDGDCDPLDDPEAMDDADDVPPSVADADAQGEDDDDRDGDAESHALDETDADLLSLDDADDDRDADPHGDAEPEGDAPPVTLPLVDGDSRLQLAARALE